MISVVVYQHSKVITGFHISGHADHASYGKDIICAAVSTLAVNAVNSIEKFTDDRLTVNERDGEIEVHFDSGPCPDSRLLVRSMVLGMKDIQASYGKKYIRLVIQEV